MSQATVNIDLSKAACTPAWMQYMRSYFALMDFFEFDILMHFSIPLVMQELPQKDPDLYRKFAIYGKRSGFQDNPELAKRTILELMLCRLVDNFHSYLADALSNVFVVKPTLLNLTEEERAKVKKSYGCSSEEEVLFYAPIHRVDCLSKSKTASQILEFAQKELNITASISHADKYSMDEVAAVRNIVVHNRGRVNAKFLRDTGQQKLIVGQYTIGEFVDFTTEDCSRWSESMHNVVDAFDQAIVTAVGGENLLQHFAPEYDEERRKTPFSVIERAARLADNRAVRTAPRAII